MDKLTVIRTEQGWPAHFIDADRCRFRRNTLLDNGTTKIIVSTIGNMRDLEGVAMTIGLHRYYETKAWEATFRRGYWEVDLDREVFFESSWSICYTEMVELGSDADNAANAMHEKVVQELTEKLSLKE